MKEKSGHGSIRKSSKCLSAVTWNWSASRRLIRGELIPSAGSPESFAWNGGLAPAAGFETTEPNRRRRDTDFLTSIASARQEAQAMFELSQDLGDSLSLERDAFRPLDAAAQADSLRFDCGICEPQWLVAAGTGERREFSRSCRRSKFAWAKDCADG